MAVQPAGRRKQFWLKADVLRALEGLSHDSGKSADAWVDEALRNLFKKHQRPLTIKDALRTSVRNMPANDPVPKRPRAKA